MLLKSMGILVVAGVICEPSFALASNGEVGPAESPATKASSSSSPAETTEDDSLDASGMEDIDERFATEGYVGTYAALFQQTVPAVGVTGSIYLDDDFRFGADLSLGGSKGLYGGFKTQGGSVWSAFEITDSFWLKGGLSYVRLDKPTTQDPLSVITKGEDKKLAKNEVRSDALAIDFAFGQLWSRKNYTISADYIGFSLPALRLTGPGLPLFSLNALRFELLYNLE